MFLDLDLNRCYLTLKIHLYKGLNIKEIEAIMPFS